MRHSLYACMYGMNYMYTYIVFWNITVLITYNVQREIFREPEGVTVLILFLKKVSTLLTSWLLTVQCFNLVWIFVNSTIHVINKCDCSWILNVANFRISVRIIFRNWRLSTPSLNVINSIFIRKMSESLSGYKQTKHYLQKKFTVTWKQKCITSSIVAWCTCIVSVS